MLSRLHPFFAVTGAVLCLSACGGGSSSSTPVTGPTLPPGPPPPASSVAVAPSSLAFVGPGTGAQTFTVSSTTPNPPFPTIDQFGCSPVATITTSSTTLPATYTVTPTGNGVCSVVVTIGNRSASLGINVGGGSGGSFTTSANPLTFTLGGPAQTYTATASSGTLSADTASCNGIASVSGGGGGSPQTFTVSPVSVGSCTLSIVDGSNALLVPIVVNPSSNASSAVLVSPSALSFASQADAPQQVSLNFQGSVGQVTIDESSCTANGAKIAFLTLNGVAPGTPVTLPQTATIQPYGSSNASGSCTIIFTPQSGASATLTVTVNR
ncbi:MAG TPA: hypothetical protein VIW69_18745 [Candidatus Elarobacter sp.]